MEGVVQELALGRLALRHVAEAPHAAGAAAVHALRHRVALEHAPVVELQLVEALRLGRRIELVHLAKERLGVAQLPHHVRQRTFVVARLGDVLGDAPQLDEAAVEQRDVAHPVGGEDPVGGGLERGPEQRRGAREILGAPREVRLVREEQRDAVLEREGPDVEHALATHVGEMHREAGRTHRAIGQRAGERGAQRGARELRPRLRELLAEHVGARASGEPLGGRVPELHASVAPQHEHPLVDRLDDLGEARLGAPFALEQLARLHRAQAEEHDELREQQDDDHELERLVRRLLGILAPHFRVRLVPVLHRQETGAGAVERRRPELEVGGDGERRLPLEDRRDHLVADAQVLGPVFLEPPRRGDLPRAGEPRGVLGHAQLHPLVRSARLVGVLDLQVGVRRRQRVQHAPPRFLRVELQAREEIEPAHETVVQPVRLARRAPHLPQAERTGGDAHERVADEEQRGAASTHERAHPCDHCALTSRR